MHGELYVRGRAVVLALTMVLTALMAGSLEAGVKNVIIMVADGVGFTTLDAASYYQHGQLGQQPYDDFDVKFGMTTYEHGGSYDPAMAWDTTPSGGTYPFAAYNYLHDSATDSGASATSISTGQKTDYGKVAWSVDNQPLTSILEIAKNMGKSTGTVTTVEFAHATPAAFGAHNPNRNNWLQISNEMLNSGALDVIMGAGHPGYDNNGNARATHPDGWNYDRVGGRAQWESLVAGTHPGDWTFIESKQQFEDLASGALVADRLVGVAQVERTLQQKRSGNTSTAYAATLNSNVPTLATMSLGAINVLNQHNDGFFVMIEGGAVDFAAHDNHKGRLIEEQIDFNLAVQAVLDWVNANSSWDETLLIVTSDHGNALPIGPNALTNPFDAIVNNGAGNMPDFMFLSGDHTNELVPVFAHGAGSELLHQLIRGYDPVRGAYVDNTDLFHVMYEAMLPEPASLTLLLVGAAAMMRRNRVV